MALWSSTGAKVKSWVGRAATGDATGALVLLDEPLPVEVCESPASEDAVGAALLVEAAGVATGAPVMTPSVSVTVVGSVAVVPGAGVGTLSDPVPGEVCDNPLPLSGGTVSSVSVSELLPVVAVPALTVGAALTLVLASSTAAPALGLAVVVVVVVVPVGVGTGIVAGMVVGAGAGTGTATGASTTGAAVVVESVLVLVGAVGVLTTAWTGASVGEAVCLFATTGRVKDGMDMDMLSSVLACNKRTKKAESRSASVLASTKEERLLCCECVTVPVVEEDEERAGIFKAVLRIRFKVLLV
jgi:hypothetical protein